MRLHAENSEKPAGQRRFAIPIRECGDKQRARKKPVLPGENVHQHDGRQREKAQSAAVAAFVRNPEIDDESHCDPCRVTREIGKESEWPDEQQDMRWIGPIVIRQFRVKQAVQNGVVIVEIEVRLRIAVQSGLCAHPCVHEIPAERRMQTIIGRLRCAEIEELEQREKSREANYKSAVDRTGFRHGSLRRVGDYAIAAVAFGAIKRLVGTMQQRIGGIPIAFRSGDTDADGDVEFARIAADDGKGVASTLLRRRSATM